MKFFTADWASGELPDDEFEAVPARYADYIRTLALPADVLALDEANLHDGVLAGVRSSGSCVVLELVTGDLQRGYFMTEIAYVVEDSSAAGAVRNFIGGDIEVVYAEVDRTASGFVHRLLFSTDEQVEIAFKSVVVRQSPRAGRDVAR